MAHTLKQSNVHKAHPTECSECGHQLPKRAHRAQCATCIKGSPSTWNARRHCWEAQDK